MSLSAEIVEELAYADYQKRQRAEVDAEGLNNRVSLIKTGGKFHLNKMGCWKPSPYQGYAILSMVSDRLENGKLQARLENIVKTLKRRVYGSEKFYFLPPESYHQTVANLLSSNRYQNHLVDKGLEEAFPSILEEVAERYNPMAQQGSLVVMKMIGISIFGTSIGLLGEFPLELDYQRIIHFRDHIYGYPTLSSIGIIRTRPFIGHITLAYLEYPLFPEEKESLVKICNSINYSIKRQALYFFMEKAGLHHYQNLSLFGRQPHFPQIYL